jgi:hypothetical protein
MFGVCSKEDEGNNQEQEITKIINQTKKAESRGKGDESVTTQ